MIFIFMYWSVNLQVDKKDSFIVKKPESEAEASHSNIGDFRSVYLKIRQGQYPGGGPCLKR